MLAITNPFSRVCRETMQNLGMAITLHSQIWSLMVSVFYLHQCPFHHLTSQSRVSFQLSIPRAWGSRKLRVRLQLAQQIQLYTQILSRALILNKTAALLAFSTILILLTFLVTRNILPVLTIQQIIEHTLQVSLAILDNSHPIHIQPPQPEHRRLPIKEPTR